MSFPTHFSRVNLPSVILLSLITGRLPSACHPASHNTDDNQLDKKTRPQPSKIETLEPSVSACYPCLAAHRPVGKDVA